MMTVTRRRRKQVSEINVVPYIDVMLVLLIIFMVTAPLITQGVKVDLPKASAEPLPPESEPPIVVSVDRDGNFYLSTANNPNVPQTAQVIVQDVNAHLQLSPNRPVVVKGDGAVQYNQVVQLMVLLQKAGVPQVGLMTDSSADGGS
ncbi:MAG: protein TolR [Gammaproteobacteria bacterium]|nr:protein TolR [Gammaproteobacteria bacterium]